MSRGRIYAMVKSNRRLQLLGHIARNPPAGGRMFARLLWPAAIPSGPKPVLTSSGFAMHIDMSVWYQREMCLGLYERTSVLLLSRMLNAASVFIDVGANIGFFHCLSLTEVDQNVKSLLSNLIHRT